MKRQPNFHTVISLPPPPKADKPKLQDYTHARFENACKLAEKYIERPQKARISFLSVKPIL